MFYILHKGLFYNRYNIKGKETLRMSIVKKMSITQKYLFLTALVCASLLSNVSSSNIYAASSSPTASTQTITLMKATTPSKAAIPKEVSRKVCVNGNYLSGIKVLDQNGTTLLPLRSVAESLNCEVNFDPTNKVAIVLSDNNTIELPLGYTFGVINGTKTAISGNASSVLYNASTYLPVRFVSEALSCSINYDSTSKTVFITTNGGSASEVMGTAPQQQSPAQTTQPTQSTQQPPTASTAQPGTAQYCFDNKLSLDNITAENCTKRLTQEQWYQLLPHTKGSDLSYAVEHTTPVIIHIPNIDSKWVTLHDGKIMVEWKKDSYYKVAAFTLGGSIPSGDVYTYFKDGTYKNLGNIPKDKDLDDISFITFPVLTKDNNPVQVLVFPDHIEQNLIKGVDGVALFK